MWVANNEYNDAPGGVGDSRSLKNTAACRLVVKLLAYATSHFELHQPRSDSSDVHCDHEDHQAQHEGETAVGQQ